MYDLKKWDAYIKHWGCGRLMFHDMMISRARHAKLAQTNWYAVGAEAKHMHVDYAVASILVGNYPLPFDFFWEPVRAAIKQTINERYERTTTKPSDCQGARLDIPSCVSAASSTKGD